MEGPRRRGPQTHMTLDVAEFLRCFLLHVLPRGMVRIRCTPTAESIGATSRNAWARSTSLDPGLMGNDRPRVILLDIEGTTTLVEFVYSTLFPYARQHLEEGIARYTPDQRRAPVFRIGQDPGVGCRAYAARALW